jgi:hypothetical protein
MFERFGKALVEAVERRALMVGRVWSAATGWRRAAISGA